MYYNLKTESLFNVICRIVRSIKMRMRGKIFWLFRTFMNGSSSKIAIGKNVRIKNGKLIQIKGEVGIGDNARLECYLTKNELNYNDQPKLIIGQGVSFGDNLHIGSCNKITIGKNVLVASKVLIIDHDHGKTNKSYLRDNDLTPRERPLISKGEIVIEDNVWIGESVIILAGSYIGKGAIIGANSLVNCRVNDYSIFINK